MTDVELTESMPDPLNQPGTHTCLVWLNECEQSFIIQAPSRKAVLEMVRVLDDIHDVDWPEHTPTIISPNFGPAPLTYYEVYHSF